MFRLVYRVLIRYEAVGLREGRALRFEGEEFRFRWF